MLAPSHERSGDRLELLDRAALVGLEETAGHHLQVAVVALVVLRDGPAEPARSPSRTTAFHGWRSRSDGSASAIVRQPPEEEVDLDRHRLLAPERAVVVEDGDPLLGRHGRAAARRHGSTNSTIAASCGGVVPGRAAASGHHAPDGAGAVRQLLHRLVDGEARRLLTRRELLERREELGTTID